MKMSQQTKLGKLATSVRQEDGLTVIRYHYTDIVKFDDKRIILNTGGWYTATTKTRMNQASNQFNLGYKVFQKDNAWFVSYSGKYGNVVEDFENGIMIDRLAGSIHFANSGHVIAGAL